MAGEGSSWRIRLLVGASIFLVLLLLLWGLAGVLLHRKVVGEARAWAAMGRDLEQLGPRHSKRGADDSALRVEQLAGRLGLDLTPRASSRPSIDLPSRRVDGDARDAAGNANNWMGELFVAEGTELSPPPEELAPLLEQHAQDWAKLVAHLRQGPPAHWEQDLGLPWEAPVPNLLGILQLHRLLLGQALAEQRAGRPQRAEELFEASWRFSFGLRERSELISQLIAIAVARTQAAAARRLTELPADPWAERLLEHDFRESLADAWQGEARQFFEVSRQPARILAGGKPVTTGNRILGTAGRPIFELTCAQVLAHYRGILAELEAVRPCPPDPRVFSNPATPYPSWNPLLRMFGAGLDNSVYRAEHAALQLELSRKVLLAREALRAGGPEALAHAALGQALCGAASWVILPGEDGGFSVEYSGPAPPWSSSGPAFPLRHVEPPRGEGSR